MTRPRLQESALRLFPLAWPVFVGQIAVLAFSTVDTVMTARASALDLAALAIGGSVYISVFVGLMGVILAVGPIAGQLFGAGKHRESGHEAEQAVWLALALAVLGCAVLLLPEPFLALAGPSRRWPRRCAATCAASPVPCPPRWCSWPIAASTSPSRGRRR
jgi:MATE family multidrug resistance protein